MIKNVNNDTRYIIKRILIGVGIAIILGFLKTNNVLAEERNLYISSDSPYYSFTNSNIANQEFLSFDSPYSNNSYNLNVSFDTSSMTNKYYLIFYSESLNIYYYIIFDNYTGVSYDLSRLYLHYSSNYNRYVFTYGCLEDNNNYNCDSDNFPIDTVVNGLDYGYILSNNIDLDTSLFSNNILNRLDSPFSSEFLFYNNNRDIFLNQNFIDYFELYDTNLSYLKIDDDIINIPDIPSSFSELDLTDYNAVYFLPKDYSTIPTREVDNHDFIDFSFYFKGGVNYGYFNLVNNEQIVFLPLFDNLSSSTYFTLVESSFPMFYDDTDSNLDDLNAFIIYNTGGVTQVAYNNNLFDYYLIKDLNSYSQEITYIDNLGNSVTKTITFTQTLEEMWESGFSQDSNNWWLAGFKNKDKLNNYIQLLKLPYRLFVLLYNKIIGGMCTDFIIPFPHLGNIRVTCLSVVFRNVLGNNFFSAFKILINTFYVITIVFANVKFLMKQLSPELIWFGNNL